MKQLSFLAIALLLAACNPQADSNEIPEDLAEQRSMLKEKRAELAELTKVINELEDRIEEADPSARPKAVVTTEKVKVGDFSTYVKIQGNVEADDLFDATAEVGGRILSLNADEGDFVRRGQLIAVLDDEQIKKQIAELETSLSLATTVYERQNRLWEQNIGSEIQLLEAKNNKERLEKNLEILQLQLGKTKVYAPASGQVDRVVLQSGELAAPGLPIIQILNTNKLKVTADVPENFLGKVDRGERVDINFPAINSQQKAAVSLIGRTIDPANRTFAIEVNIPSRDERIKPNLLAEVLLEDARIENAVTIPLNQVQQEVGGQNFVFIIQEGTDGPVAKKVYIETGRAYDGDVVVESGLKGGERLIIDGARNVADNVPLTITEPQTAEKNG